MEILLGIIGTLLLPLGIGCIIVASTEKSFTWNNFKIPAPKTKKGGKQLRIIGLALIIFSMAILYQIVCSGNSCSTPDETSSLPQTETIIDENSNSLTPEMCNQRFDPNLPCMFLVERNDSFIKIATDAYSNPAYGLVILNFNRDEQGYRPFLEIGDLLYLPSRADISNPLEPTFPTTYLECYLITEGGKGKPCIYIATAGDTFIRLADKFYGFPEAETCIEEANFLFDPFSENLELITELEGRTLILPQRSFDHC